MRRGYSSRPPQKQRTYASSPRSEPGVGLAFPSTQYQVPTTLFQIVNDPRYATHSRLRINQTTLARFSPRNNYEIGHYLINKQRDRRHRNKRPRSSMEPTASMQPNFLELTPSVGRFCFSHPHSVAPFASVAVNPFRFSDHPITRSPITRFPGRRAIARRGQSLPS